MRKIVDHDGDYVKVRRERDGITVEASQKGEEESYGDYAIVGPIDPDQLIEAIYSEMGWMLPTDVNIKRLLRNGADAGQEGK